MLILRQRSSKRTQELQQSNDKLQREIEQRQQLLEALARSLRERRSLAEQLPEVIARINRNHTIAFVNRDIGGRSP